MSSTPINKPSGLSPRLNPIVRQLLDAIRAEGGPAFETLTPAEARKLVLERPTDVGGTPEPVRSIQNLRIPGPERDIPIRVYTPDVPSPAPGLVYFHGGGWVVRNLDTHDVISTAIAHRAGAVVVSVDYRLAPEHKFPAAVVDCYAATLWVASMRNSLASIRSASQ